ncbi:hypothetical protein [Massilia sp. Leaf139]|uniref:hypothetical protein n=1 Tax=Massilia sp. Leaf139 TaxID=1736272 RepID=UPI0006FAE342|nr:hypothetical protein [Massilia sp. Leaf139]KQQ88457.1 hypothetical protein ASF77_12375 [Massilia sp. Leaf139]
MKQILAAALALALVPLLATAQPLRDPFARPAPQVRAVEAEAEAPPPAPQLRAVMVAPGRALANINGQILAVGEWFGDYQLIKVDERGVTLDKRGVKSVLVLNEASRK